MCKRDVVVTLNGVSVLSQEGESVSLLVHGLTPRPNGTQEEIVRLLQTVCREDDLPVGFADDLLERLDTLAVGYALAQRVGYLPKN